MVKQNRVLSARELTASMSDEEFEMWLYANILTGRLDIRSDKYPSREAARVGISLLEESLLSLKRRKNPIYKIVSLTQEGLLRHLSTLMKIYGDIGNKIPVKTAIPKIEQYIKEYRDFCRKYFP